MLTARPHIDVEAGFPNSRRVEVRATEQDVRRYIDAQIQLSHRPTKHVAKRPALREEIENTIINPATRDSDSLPDIDIVVSVCAGLVVVDQPKVVRLINHTAKTYFDDPEHSPLPHAHIDLTTICLIYLSLESLIDKGVDSNTLNPGTSSTALQAASETGNLELVALLLDRGANVNLRGGHFGSALQAAAQEGDFEVVRLLVSRDAELTSWDVADGDALQRASRRCHFDVVQYLIGVGANVNARCGYYGSTLQAASKMGKRGVVGSLIDSGAEINAQGGQYGSALQAAASGGALKTIIIRVITEKHANAKVQRARMSDKMLADSNVAVVKL
ncbi:ankyrin repeat-containing domain protein [Mycena vulgaris]|nr:ankyrin repeat-containing domain protein [Mycena vulgaris]